MYVVPTGGGQSTKSVRPSVRIVIYVEDERFTSSRRFFFAAVACGGKLDSSPRKKIALFVSALRS